MLSGFEGVRYGLTVPKKESKTVPKRGLAVFGGDDSGDEAGAVGKNIERQAQKKLSDRKVRHIRTSSILYWLPETSMETEVASIELIPN